MAVDPQIQLQDSNGNVKGTVWENADGDLVLEDADSGNTIRVGDEGFVDASGAAHSGALADAANVLSQEEVEDAVDALLSGGTDISTTYDDANDNLTIDYTGSGDSGGTSLEEYDIYNPGDYGAAGDGTTDDTQAIKDAINAIPSGEKGVLQFSAGTKYYISSTITIDPSSVIGIKGQNAYVLSDQDVVFFDVVGNNPTGFDSGPDSQLDGQQLEEFNFVVRDLQCYSTTDPYVGTGIQVSQTMAARIEGCHLTKLNHGIEVTGDNRNLMIHGCNIYDNGATGIHFYSGETHQVLINDCHIMYAERCIYVDGHKVANLQINGNDIETGNHANITSVNLIEVTGSGHMAVDISDNTIEDHEAGTSELISLTGAEWVTITGNPLIANSSGDGVVLNGCNDVVVSDNVIKTIPGHAVVADDTTVTDTVTVTNNNFDGVNGAVLYGRQMGVNSRLKLTDNIGRDVGRLVDIDLVDTYQLHTDISNNVIDFTDAPVLLVDVIDSTNNMRSLNVRGNQFWLKGSATPSTGNYVYDIRATEISELKVAENSVYARGASVSGYRVDVTTPNLVHVTDNSAREVGNTDYDLPASSTSGVLVRDNLPLSGSSTDFKIGDTALDSPETGDVWIDTS